MQAAINQDMVQRFINIVEENFSNGIRDDFIDTGKILRIFSVYYPEEIIYRDSLIELIHTNGIETSGRFYFISEDRIESIQYFLDEILKKSPIAYYVSIYRKHFDFFARMNIFSSEVLKKTLQIYDTRHFHFNESCSNYKAARLESEVVKIFNKLGNPLTVEDLQKKLPYVPTEKISAVLSDTKNFFMTSKRNYIFIAKIKFDEQEIEEVKNKIFLIVDAEGCAAIEDCDFSSNFVRNIELAERDLRNIIYEKYLSYDFIRRGNKLFKKNSSFQRKDSMSLTGKLRKILGNQNEVSLKKLYSIAQSFGISQSVALSAAYETMIRVDENFFVKDTLINFNVSGIDKALSSYVQGKIIPLRAVTSFTSFPQIENYSWNLFLLESYLRKYSQQYIFNSPGAGNANIGSIYPKFKKFADYLEVQTAAVMQEKIPQTKIDVGNFLVEQGYRTKRLDRVTEKIIKRAQEISNR